nr:MAG TPA: hypothetical protein [Siphoviridae sp. ctedi74]
MRYRRCPNRTPKIVRTQNMRSPFDVRIRPEV